VLVDVPGAVARYAVVLGVSREGARAAAQRFLQQPIVPQALQASRARIELSLCYVPFYEFSAFRLGTFLLKETVKPPAPVGEEGTPEALDRWLREAPIAREDTRVVETAVLRIGPACRLPELGVERIPLEGLRRSKTPVALEPFDLGTLQRRAVVFTPTEPPQRFREDAEWRIPVRSDRTGLVAQRLKLLYYPIWRARYLYAGRPYQIAVDGVTGGILAVQGPADLSPGIAVAVGVLAAAAFCLGRAIPEVLQSLSKAPAHAGVSLFPPLLVLACLLGVVGWVALGTFRRGAELVLTGNEEAPRVEVDAAGGVLDGIRRAMAEGMVRFRARNAGWGGQ
jgi:hypothetical protein